MRRPVMQIQVNGKPRQLGGEPTSVATLVRELGLEAKRIAVERNGAIVPRSRYEATLLQNGDTLEIVAAVGGG